MLPSPKRGVGNRIVQVKEELICTATDRRHLTKCQSQTHSFFQFHVLSAHCLVFEQSHKTAASRMRPNVALQQIAKFDTGAERDLTLSNPLDYGITPMPMAQ